MADEPFLQEEFRVLTPEAFDFVLNNELKRAVRSQNFLTLVVVDPQSEERVRQDAVRQIAQLVSREVRETDLLSATPEGRLSMVLLDADMQSSMRVIDRLMIRLEHYQFATPLAIAVGAACCPTHGSDADTLRRVAEARTVMPRREPGARSNASNAQ
jgi:GGDEF domain-containing protein